MTRRVTFFPKALSDLMTWQEEDSKMIGRILRLIEEARRDPFKGIGKPEPLKGNLKGKWSRRITDEHRLVYSVTDDELLIISLRGHYTD
ncbi:MAG: Txe/YoeB family addiction module toxin [Cytophagales bacterium]|nr:MAG: Txe/YoeB family addiction module toxin [Cytophagales bacterium]